MNIFILEEDLYYRQRLERLIKEVLTEKTITIRKIVVTGRPKKLLEKVTEQGCHQLFFLDTTFNKDRSKGFRVAQSIREKDPNSTIVFVTGQTELASESFRYKISALDVIEKNQAERELKKRLEECLELVDSRQNQLISQDAFHFETNQSKFQLPYSEILYFETLAIPHKVNVVTKHKKVEFYGSLNGVVKQDQRFYRCHRSYLINLENVSYVDKQDYTVYFEKDKKCYVARRRMKELLAGLDKLR